MADDEGRASGSGDDACDAAAEGVSLGYVCAQFRSFMRNVRPAVVSSAATTENATFTRIALQLPDAPAQETEGSAHDSSVSSDWQALHLGHASAIARALTVVAREFNTETARPRVFVLGDTSFGSCCVDAVAAQHLSADAIVHFGHACMSAPSDVPALYILDRVACAEAAIAAIIAQHVSDAAACSEEDDAAHVLLLWEPAYAHAVPRVLALAAASMPHADAHDPYEAITATNVPRPFLHACRSPSPRLLVPHYTTVSLPQPSPPTPASGHVLSVCGLHALIPAACIDAATGEIRSRALRVVHIGTHAPRTRMLLARFADTRVTCVHASTGVADVITSASSRVMAARYRCVEAVRNARVVCIVVCTLTLAGRNDIVAKLRAAASAAGKQTFVILIGKPSHTKLGNFPDMDVFICVSCPEHTLMDERVAAGVRVPIATPHEAFVGLDAGVAWTGTSEVDFTRVMHDVRIPERASCGADECACAADDGAAAFDAAPSALARRDGTGGAITVHTSEAASRLARREWRGLQYDTDPTQAADTRVHQGASGIARAYTYETAQPSSDS